MSRNSNRLGTPEVKHPDPPVPTSTFDPLSFVAPTEFVEIPSLGAYPSDHPLHGKEVIEIRFMTAKDEDILASQALLKKGLAIERFMENIIVDKSIKASSLLVGDRNAILIAARSSGYGAAYETQIACVACGTPSKFTFDLTKTNVKVSEESEGLSLTRLENGNFTTKMPYSKFNIEFRLLNGKDENMLAKLLMDKRKRKMSESTLTDQYNRMIVSIEGHSDKNIIKRYVDNLPTMDSRHLRACYKVAAPNVEVKEPYTCSSCDYEQELEVPFGADFFWPDR